MRKRTDNKIMEAMPEGTLHFGVGRNHLDGMIGDLQVDKATVRNVKIVPVTEEFIEGIHRCFDSVARERRYLARVQAPPFEETREFILSNIANNAPQFMALSGGQDLLRKFRPMIFSEFSPPALDLVSGVSAEAYLRLLLIDEGYTIAVCDKDGDLVDCKRDMDKVIKCFQDSGVDHIDVVAYPVDG